MICRGGKERLKKIHNRLLMGMSFMDILNSVALGLFSTPFPKELSGIIYGASGTKATCTAQGFFITLGFSVPLYNCCLCLYYLAVIKYDKKEDELQKYEKYMHAIPIFIALSLAVSGLWLDLYKSTDYLVICYIEDGIVGKLWKSMSPLDLWPIEGCGNQ